MATLMVQLGNEPAHFSDCCAGISKPLINILVEQLPQPPALILSVGCGSGLLEAVLLEASEEIHGVPINLYGVEVSSQLNRHLSKDRLLVVNDTRSLHPDALLASALMFVYPRDPNLIASYLANFSDGALETLFWLGHRNDWPDAAKIIRAAFYKLDLVDDPGIPEYELLAIAHLPNPRGQK